MMLMRFAALGSPVAAPTTDPYIANVSLLLHADTPDSSGDASYANTPFLMRGKGANASSAIFTERGVRLTNSGSPVISTAQSKFNGSSVNLNGSSYLQHSGSGSAGTYNLGSGAYTIETWVYPVTRPSPWSGIFSALTDSPAAGWRLLYDNNGKVNFGAYGTSTTSPLSTAALPTGAWSHVAVTRDASGTGRLFINGVLDSTWTPGTNAIPNSSSDLIIGANSDASRVWKMNGYLADARITVGVCRYTASFTPPSIQVPNYGATWLVDSSPSNIGCGFFNQAAMSSSSPKYGDGAFAFDGATDYIATASIQAGQFGSGDFTVEAWVNIPATFTAIDAYTVCGTYRASGNRGWRLLLTKPNGTPQFNWSADGVAVQSGHAEGPNPTIGAWNHVAAVRSGSTVTVYTNGVAGTPVAISGSIFNADAQIFVGMSEVASEYSYFGKIDDVRITKGVARYTGNFTPIGPFPNS